MSATNKSFNELLKELHEFDEVPPQRLLVKAHIPTGAKAKPLPKPVLGMLLKSAVSDAVAAGRISGTTAMEGLRALGLEDK